MRYSGEQLNAIAEKIDLAEYIEQTEELHRKGQNYFIKCPFHKGDDTPSLCIYEETQRWHCFGCGKDGNIYNWIMYKEGLSFGDAIERVMKMTGVELKPLVETPTVQFLKSLNKQNTLPKDTITDRIILDWQTDYFDKYSADLPKEWLAEDMTEEALKTYQIRIDKSTNRIVYPVCDSDGNLIGVKGRTRLNNYKALGLQKYINYYKIGTIDYFQGWQQAEIKTRKSVIIFEGVKSCIKAWGWNIRNTIAAETANLSDGQLQLLIKSAFNEVIIGFDNDKKLNSIISNPKIQMLKKFAKVSVIIDKNKVLDEKMAPVDKGEQIFRELLERRIKI